MKGLEGKVPILNFFPWYFGIRIDRLVSDILFMKSSFASYWLVIATFKDIWNLFNSVSFTESLSVCVNHYKFITYVYVTHIGYFTHFPVCSLQICHSVLHLPQNSRTGIFFFIFKHLVLFKGLYSNYFLGWGNGQL